MGFSYMTLICCGGMPNITNIRLLVFGCMECWNPYISHKMRASNNEILSYNISDIDNSEISSVLLLPTKSSSVIIWNS